MTFLLVHGAFHGGWCWEFVAEHLSREGFKVLTPSLSGMEIPKEVDPIHVNLDTHIADVCSIIKSQPEGGHSLRLRANFRMSWIKRSGSSIAAK